MTFVRRVTDEWHLHSEERAQGTVEYAVVTSVFVVIVTALALLVRAGQEGVLLSLVEEAASHVFSAAGAVDIALY